MTLEQLKAVLDNHFSHPFLPEGTVKTKWINTPGKEAALEIRIGRRDVWVTEAGEVIGAGTHLIEDKP
jgi:hypothetical protein